MPCSHLHALIIFSTKYSCMPSSVVIEPGHASSQEEKSDLSFSLYGLTSAVWKVG